MSGGASRAAAARVLSRGKHSRIHGTWDMGHGTWDMGHSSIISLCRVEQSGGEWSGVDSDDSEDRITQLRMQLLVTSTSPTLG